MARRLDECGHAVVGVDPAPTRRDEWQRETGRPAVADVSAVEWSTVRQLVVVVGTQEQAVGLLNTVAELAADELGVVIVSTVRTSFWTPVRERAPRPWRLLEAPVTGGEARARSGEITLFMHGPAAEGDRAVLDDLSGRLIEFDRYGQPSLAKLLNNTLAATNAMNVARALALAAERGITPEVLLSALNEGSGRSMISQHLGEFSTHQYELLEKDVGLLHADAPGAELGESVTDLARVVEEALGDRSGAGGSF